MLVTEKATEICSNNCAVLSMVPTVAVFTSLKKESADEFKAPRSIPIIPCASYADEAPAVCVVERRERSQALFVTEPGFALEVMVASEITVPLPQPDTVQSLALRVTVATEAAGVLYTPAAQIFNVRNETFSVFAGIVQAIRFWSLVVEVLTVTGVTLTHPLRPSSTFPEASGRVSVRAAVDVPFRRMLFVA